MDIEIIPGSIYTKISDKLIKKIDVTKLPLFGEKEIYKISAERYGKVRIKLDIENDLDILKQIERYDYHDNGDKIMRNHYTYKWEVDEQKLPKRYEQYIKPEILNFIKILSVFNNNNSEILRFSVVDGDFKDSERPAHMLATILALIDLFDKI